MSTIKQSAPFGAAAYRSIVLAATLVVTTLKLIDSAAAAQPTLKDVIEKSAKEEEVKEKPKEKSTEKPTEKSKATQPDPDQEFKRGAPRTSVQGFLNAAHDLDYERAAQYLQLPGWMSESQGPQLARHLRIAFDRAPLWIDLDLVSNKPEGHSDDGLPWNRDLLGRNKRDMIWYHPKIRLRYDSTPDQVRYILVQAQKILYSHPKVSSDSASIRFVELGTYSLDLDVFAYIALTDYGEVKQVAEDLNLRIIDIVAEAGARLALPSRIMAADILIPPA